MLISCFFLNVCILLYVWSLGKVHHANQSPINRYFFWLSKKKKQWSGCSLDHQTYGISMIKLKTEFFKLVKILSKRPGGLALRKYLWIWKTELVQVFFWNRKDRGSKLSRRLDSLLILENFQLLNKASEFVKCLRELSLHSDFLPQTEKTEISKSDSKFFWIIIYLESDFQTCSRVQLLGSMKQYVLT